MPGTTCWTPRRSRRTCRCSPARTGISARCAASTTRSSEIAFDDLGLDIYPNQIEVITSEQMLDAYASVGLPLMYRHWSFGKRFAHHETLYRKGLQGLAYEIVINSNPCICYIMEENSMTMQTLVHRARRVRPQSLLQEQLPVPAVDRCRRHPRLSRLRPRLRRRVRGDATGRRGRAGARCGACADGARRQPLRPPLEAEPRRGAAARRGSRGRYDEATYNDLWRTVPACNEGRRTDEAEKARGRCARGKLGLPEENLLYFIEKKAPRLDDWQRELLRIVRNVVAVFLSAEADADDERGLRHLRALRDHEPAARHAG